MIGSGPDLLRLLVVPVFAWAAWTDVRTRRLPNRLWPPLYAFGALLLCWELASRWPLVGVGDRLFVIRVAISLGIVAPLGYIFWRLGGFGGADAKALIALALAFPTFPTYFLPTARLPALPVVETYVGVFSLTILTNTVLVGIVYPAVLTLRNLATGHRSPVMFLARPVGVGRLSDRHGRLFETRDGYTRSGLDLDALRMYLRWRGLTLAAVRENPERFRDPGSVEETFAPTDGRTDVDPVADGRGSVAETNDLADAGSGRGVAGDAAEEDAWAAERFLETLGGSAYGTDPETLREGLETIARTDEVWVSPGLPFVVPMFVGLVAALTYGDVLFAILLALGWA